MAIKDKSECGVTVKTADEASLQLLRIIQSLPEQGFPQNIVNSLGKIPLPGDPTKYCQFVETIKNFQNTLAKECIKRELVPQILGAFYNEISQPEIRLSPVLSIILQLIDPQTIPKAVELILNNHYTEESIKHALLTLCKWLTIWTYTDNLEPMILNLMLGLESQNQQNIIFDVSVNVIKRFFKLLCIHNCMGRIVIFILSRKHSRPDVLLKIFPDISNVIRTLNSSDTSKMFLKELLVVLLEKMQEFPTFRSLSEPLRNDLEALLRSDNIRKDLILPSPSEMCLALNIDTRRNCKVGLENLGNTCYLNSIFQALFMTKHFRYDILFCDRDSLSLFSKFKVLFAFLQHSERPFISSININDDAKPSYFINGQQHDSSEFLSHVLDLLHEQEKAICTANGDVSPCTIVQSIFSGRSLTISKCLKCNRTSERVDIFRELQLSFPTNLDRYTVQTLLDYYQQVENLIGDNQYYCSFCGLTDGERNTCIVDAPPRLIITLKHFHYDPTSQQRTKLLYSINLECNIFIGGIRYILYAIVVHKGPSVDSGHYYTFAKENDIWYKFNDVYVTPVTHEEIRNLTPPSTPYILFYCREDDNITNDLPFDVLPLRIQEAITKDNIEFNNSRIKKSGINENKENGNNNNKPPPPPGCGNSDFASNSSNPGMWIVKLDFQQLQQDR